MIRLHSDLIIPLTHLEKHKQETSIMLVLKW